MQVIITDNKFTTDKDAVVIRRNGYNLQILGSLSQMSSQFLLLSH